MSKEDKVFKIDMHTHILPPEIPKFKEMFGYGGFIELHHNHKNCSARMMRDDGKFFREVGNNTWDADARIKECNHSEVDVQVLSTVPVMFSYWAKPKDGLYVSKIINDHIAQVVTKNPKKFIGLGTVPLQDTDLAIGELERCVNELGLAGAEIGSHVEGMSLGHERLYPFFEAAEKLNAAIFIHPWEMMGQDRMPEYWLPWLVGMPAETAQSIVTLIFSGIFEKLPKLRVAFAHGGGSFPFTIGRIEHGYNVRPDLCAIHNKVNPRDYLGKFWVDSLVHDESALKFLIEQMGSEKVALGSDYPFPLGEHRPGELIESLDWIDPQMKTNLFHQSALTWLNRNLKDFI